MDDKPKLFAGPAILSTPNFEIGNVCPKCGYGNAHMTIINDGAARAVCPKCSYSERGSVSDLEGETK